MIRPRVLVALVLLAAAVCNATAAPGDNVDRMTVAERIALAQERAQGKAPLFPAGNKPLVWNGVMTPEQYRARKAAKESAVTAEVEEEAREELGDKPAPPARADLAHADKIVNDGVGALGADDELSPTGQDKDADDRNDGDSESVSGSVTETERDEVAEVAPRPPVDDPTDDAAADNTGLEVAEENYDEARRIDAAAAEQARAVLGNEAPAAARPSRFRRPSAGRLTERRRPGQRTMSGDRPVLSIGATLGTGAAGFVFKGQYAGNDVAVKIAKISKRRGGPQGDNAALQAAALAVLGSNRMSREKKIFVEKIHEYVMECEFVRSMMRAGVDEVGAKHIIPGVGPVCVLLNQNDVAGNSKDLQGDFEVASDSFFAEFPEMFAPEGVRFQKQMTEAAKTVAATLFDRGQIPVILLEFGTLGTLPEWSEPEHENILEAMSKKGNAYDGLRAAFVGLWEGVHYMASGNPEAGRQPFIHRDLKAANTVVSAGPDGRPVVKIVDFGFGYRSRFSTTPAGEDDAAYQKAWREDLIGDYENQMIGTPGFWPPETAGVIADFLASELKKTWATFQSKLESPMGYGWAGRFDPSPEPADEESKLRTTLISDDAHPTVRASRDSFTVGIMLAKTLWNRAKNWGDSSEDFFEYRKYNKLLNPNLVGGFPQEYPIAHGAATGCEGGQTYYHEQNNEWWGVIEGKFGAESDLIRFLKRALICNIRDRLPALELARAVSQTELNLETCSTGAESGLCKELMSYSTRGEPSIGPMSADSGSTSSKGPLDSVVIGDDDSSEGPWDSVVVRGGDDDSDAGGSVVIGSDSGDEEPEFNLGSFARRKYDDDSSSENTEYYEESDGGTLHRVHPAVEDDSEEAEVSEYEESEGGTLRKVGPVANGDDSTEISEYEESPGGTLYKVAGSPAAPVDSGDSEEVEYYDESPGGTLRRMSPPPSLRGNDD